MRTLRRRPASQPDRQSREATRRHSRSLSTLKRECARARQPESAGCCCSLLSTFFFVWCVRNFGCAALAVRPHPPCTTPHGSVDDDHPQIQASESIKDKKRPSHPSLCVVGRNCISLGTASCAKATARPFIVATPTADQLGHHPFNLRVAGTCNSFALLHTYYCRTFHHMLCPAPP